MAYKNPEIEKAAQRRYRETHREQIAAYTALHREKYNAARLAKYHADPEPAKARSRAWNAANKERKREGARKRLYGFAPGQFKALSIAQGNRCASCGDLTDLVIDHSHLTGENRSLLCSGCNVGIGMFKEDPSRLEAAAAYLRRHAPRAMIQTEAPAGANPHSPTLAVGSSARSGGRLFCS